jgi:hypothetical protein
MKRKLGSARHPKDLRGRGEDALAKSGRDLEQMPERDAQKVVHDLQVHQVELEMQKGARWVWNGYESAITTRENKPLLCGPQTLGG